ncbi:DUF3597 domain-containing protein [Phreatobacter stygius]|uniref:DUF3597 domain-containing protein n=1 Tax=Phreatobacter stygius TaxID=1940610 RepID=A0A4D7B361_9HYPH|nr:DUF3597 domain-containing protein [Phreatobacter stygius]QCI67321.1 DUF3597 domain-containing protein [Phreatobacter stygius]
MSIFSSILNKILPGRAEAAEAPAAPAAGGAASPAPAAAGGAAPATPGAPAAPGATVDVAAVLTDLASKASQPLNWKTSIVDLMKLLNLDSSLSARKELAKELNYTGDTNDSATMNVWLHKQVMVKLAANGGKVPDDLKN